MGWMRVSEMNPAEGEYINRESLKDNASAAKIAWNRESHKSSQKHIPVMFYDDEEQEILY